MNTPPDPSAPLVRVSRPSVYWTDYIITVLVALGAGLGLGALFERELLGDPIPWFPAQVAEAIDGDTVKVTVLLHLNGLDAPEIDRERCPGEKSLGLRARDRLAQLLAAGPVRVKILGEDSMGRMGAMITAADRPAGSVLVRENLAQETPLAGRWCPGDARAVPDAIARLTAWVGLGP